MSNNDVFVIDSMDGKQCQFEKCQVIGKVFVFSIYIDAETEKYRIISSNEYADKVHRCENAFEYLKESVTAGVADEHKEELNAWFEKENIINDLKHHDTISKDFFSSAEEVWYRAVFMVGDYDDNGEIAHIMYGCQNIDAIKRSELEHQKELLNKYKLLKSVAEIYNSLHEIDLVQNTTFPYSARDKVGSIVNHTNGADQMMRDVMKATVDDAYLEEALAFTDLLTLSERMNNKRFMSIELVGKDIGWFTASFITVEQDENKNALKVVFATRIIDEIKRKEERLIYKSSTDELTGAYNRRAYEEELESISDKGIDEDFVYISVDVDGLKIVNDTLGHSAGDELIVGAYTCLNRCFGQFGKVFRTGGDEFIVLLKANDERLNNIMEALNLTIGRWSGNTVEALSLSYGYVTRRESKDMSVQDMAILADKRMYEAKASHYRTMGVDRRGRNDAHIALCSLYSIILKINPLKDSYQIVNLDFAEKADVEAASDRISVLLKSSEVRGELHPEDAEEYLQKTDLSYLLDYFSKGNTSLHIFYRKKKNEEYRQCLMEMLPSNDYSDENPALFLYIREF